MWSRLQFDVRAAIRSLSRRPVFTLVIVATLAIGIGANTAMFALVHAALLKPLPYKDPDRLVLARRTLPAGPQMWNSAPDYYDYREQTAGFETLAACGSTAVSVTVSGGMGRPDRVPTLRVSHDLLPMLGVDPVAGRQFAPDEGRASAPYVVIVSARLAERRFGSPSDALGKTLAVTGISRNRVAATIIGVMPATFRFFDAADMWVPIRRGEGDGPETRRFHNWVLIGRLKPDTSIAAVQSQVDVISRRLQQQYPGTNKVKGLRVDPLQSTLLQAQTPRLLVLMGAVGLVLLIACANVAGMLLARGVARRSELAVRAALGASRGQIATQLVTESVLLGAVSGVVGIVIALGLQRLLPIAAGLAGAGVVASGLDGQVLLFALGASIVTGILCGVAPALRDSSLRLAEHLSPGVRTTESRGGSRVRNVLVAAQVALSVVLLIGAGLLIRSLAGLMSTDLGFDTRNLLATSVNLPYEDSTQRLQFQQGLRDDIMGIAGVGGVTFTSHMPILEPWGDPPVWPANHPPMDASQERTAMRRSVTPGFFKTMGIRAISGRDLSENDRAGMPRVMVVNEAFVHEFFPDENPIGQRVMVAGGSTSLDYEIVGVVASARTDSVGQEPSASMYLSANQEPLRSLKILIRSSLPPSQLTEPVRNLVAARNSEIPVDPVVSMEAMIGDSLVSQRVTAVTLTAFSVTALLLAALGLYGVLSHHVAQRRHEIGVRLTLGAGVGTIVAHVLRRSAAMVMPGLAAGLLVSLAATKLIANLLYGVPPADPMTFIGVSAGLALVALAGSLGPAWRAARIDPVQALRGD